MALEAALDDAESLPEAKALLRASAVAGLEGFRQMQSKK